jgi:hypothetical protein
MASLDRKESPIQHERKDADMLDELEEQADGPIDRSAQWVLLCISEINWTLLKHVSPPQHCCSRQDAS